MGRFTWLQTIVDIVREELLGVNTYDVGYVVRYDPDLQQADVQPVSRTRFRNEAGNDTDENQPVVCNLPVVFPGNGRAMMDWDVQVNDYCEIHYAKNTLDDWLTGGGMNPASDEKRFSLNNATCRVGITHFGKPRPKSPTNGIRVCAADPAISNDLKVEIDIDKLSAQVSAPNVVSLKALRINIDGRLYINGVAVNPAAGSIS